MWGWNLDGVLVSGRDARRHPVILMIHNPSLPSSLSFKFHSPHPSNSVSPEDLDCCRSWVGSPSPGGSGDAREEVGEELRSALAEKADGLELALLGGAGEMMG